MALPYADPLKIIQVYMKHLILNCSILVGTDCLENKILI